MNKQIGIWVLALGLILGTFACKTAQTTAYRSLGTIAATVDASVRAYGDWYAAGKSNNAEREQVKTAYETYQAGMRVAQKITQTAIESPTGQSDYVTAVNVVSASGQSVIDLIAKITKGK